jgi:D-glycero-alpha-D-manno-heptose-7-phosphate kinase
MIIIRTPLRISFFGGGTDFPDYFLSEGGSVLSSAIDKYVYVIVKERFDDTLRLSYTKTENVNQVDDIDHELIRESLKKTGINKGIEIVTMGDIPAGTGLGSSSAITVGALQALYAYQGILATKEKLAHEACEIEIEILKKPIGFQDQYIAAMGGLRFFEFNRDGTVACDCLELDQTIMRQLSDHLLLFFTGTTRMAANILTEQKAEIQRNWNTLGQMKIMADTARQYLIQGRFEEFGTLLSESWELKKSLASGISNSEFDEIFLTACKAGALGGKITGAGGGGFLLLFCPPEKQPFVREALKPLRELPFHLEPEGSTIIFRSNERERGQR